MGIYIIIGLMAVVGMLVQNKLRSKFSHYSKVPIRAGLSGKEIAEQMLNSYGIYDVQVMSSKGHLSDHYNPAKKTVNLSPEVYSGRSVAAAAVAAHECGHAVQHATSYSMLKFRSSIVPVVSFAAGIQQYLFLGGIFFIQTMPWLLTAAIITYAITTTFALVTLPVEFDASNRALKWLESSNITEGVEHDGAKDALKWAAMTYVVAALSAVVMLLYLFLMSRD
ncbi:MAG: zinc metallopeptidase [Saprospiraceae bacterium]